MSLIFLRKSQGAVSIPGGILILVLGWVNLQAFGQNSPATTTPDRTHITEVLESLHRGRSFGQVAISPDGKRLAWVQKTREGTEIRVAGPNDLTKSERVTAAAKPEQHCHESQIAWEPDSTALAFFSDCAAPEQQSDLYLTRLNASPARRLSKLKGYEEAPAFSPDG